MTRTTSAAGRAAIIAREGCVLRAYRDSVGVWTIGVGHAATAPTPPAVREGMTITREQADEILSRDLAAFETVVNAADPKGRLTQNAFDAAVSLAFNIGRSGFARSTVARKIAEGDMAAAAEAFLLWVNPPVLAGRRRAERAQFLTPDATPELDLIRGAVARAAADMPAVPAMARPVAPPHLPPQPAPRPGIFARFWAALTGKAA